MIVFARGSMTNREARSSSMSSRKLGIRSAYRRFGNPAGLEVS
jgi:hypothetical protein